MLTEQSEISEIGEIGETSVSTKPQALTASASGLLILAADGLIEAVSTTGDASERFRVGTTIFEYFDTTSTCALRDCMARAVEQAVPKSCRPVCTSTSRETVVLETQIVSFPAPDESMRKYALSWQYASLGQSPEQERVAASSQYVGLTAPEVAHDLNNYFTTIISIASFLMEDLPSGDSRLTDVHELLEAANQATKLTEQLLKTKPPKQPKAT